MKQCLGGGHIREMPKRRGAASASTGSNVYSKDLVFFAVTTTILIFWRTSPYVACNSPCNPHVRKYWWQSQQF
jgi:hypothetical protein